MSNPYVDYVIKDQMAKIKYLREHREVCSKKLLKLIDSYTDEEIEQRLKDILPIKWNKIVTAFEKTVVRNIEGR